MLFTNSASNSSNSNSNNGLRSSRCTIRNTKTAPIIEETKKTTSAKIVNRSQHHSNGDVSLIINRLETCPPSHAPRTPEQQPTLTPTTTTTSICIQQPQPHPKLELPTPLASSYSQQQQQEVVALVVAVHQIPAGKHSSTTPKGEEDAGEVPDLIFEEQDELPPSRARILLPPIAKTPTPMALTSCLKKKKDYSTCSTSTATTTTTNHLAHRPSTERRVRGLWRNVDLDMRKSLLEHKQTPFLESRLRDETLVRIFSYLNLADVCRAGMVGRRWKYILHTNNNSSAAEVWKRVDATDFVHQAHANFTKQRQKYKQQQLQQEAGSKCTTAKEEQDDVQVLTGQALERVLKGHNPHALTIRNIQNRLSADHYLPSMASPLQELTLTDFDNLTDTHVHVMLLMTLNKNNTKKPKQNAHVDLRSLTIQDCPLLTNASIRSIAVICTNLERLSLRGNTQIDDIAPLAALLSTVTKTQQPLLAISSSTRNSVPSSLASFFMMPAPAPAPAPTIIVEPPATPPRASSPPPLPPTSSLTSLFAPPGMSPPRTTTTRPSNSISSLTGLSRSHLPILSLNTIIGQLKHLDLCGTQITATKLLECLVSQTTNDTNDCLIVLQSLQMSGEPWKDAHLGQLATVLALDQLEELDLDLAVPMPMPAPLAVVGKHNSKKRPNSITNKGLQSLALAATPRFSKLRTLNLSGHAHITARGVASIVSHAPRLQELVLVDCPGVSNEEDIKGMDKLVKALAKTSNPCSVTGLIALPKQH